MTLYTKKKSSGNMKKFDRKQVKKHIIIPGLLEIQSNVDKIYTKYGASIDNELIQFEDNELILNYTVLNDFESPTYLNQKYHFFYGKESLDEIYYERPIVGNFKVKLLIKDIKEESPKMFVNSFYYRYIRFQVESVYPPYTHLTDIATIKLLEKGYISLHSSAISYDNDGILIFAPPDTGKTLTALSSLDFGYKFISEDITISDGKYIIGCPFTSTFYHLLNKTDIGWSKYIIYNISNKISSAIPILGYFIGSIPKNVFEIIGEKKIDKKAKIKMICILGKGDQNIKEVDKEETFLRLSILNRSEFNYYKNPLLLTYFYFNKDLDLNKLIEKEKEILLNIINRSENYLIKANNPSKYIELIRELM